MQTFPDGYPDEPAQPESMTAGELIQQLQESIDEYPEYEGTGLRACDEYGEEFKVLGTDLSGDLWIIIEEVHDRTGECACGARCDHDSVTGLKAWLRRWLR